MASMAAQLLFNKNEQTEQRIKAENSDQPVIAPATEEQVKNAIVEVVKCLDGELPLGAKAVAYIKKANLPVAALPMETVQQVLLAAAMSRSLAGGLQSESKGDDGMTKPSSQQQDGESQEEKEKEEGE